MLPEQRSARLRFIGQAACLYGEGQILVLEDKDALLLAYLAVEGPTPRKALAMLLWPDVEEARAGANLRQRLFRLRRTLTFDLVEGGAIAGLAACLSVDLACADDGEGELLSSLDEAHAAGLTQWLATARQRRWAKRVGLLQEEAQRLETEGQLGLALTAAQKALGIDPTSERAHRLVMRLHYLRGERSAALLAFDRCERLLKDEVGTRPSGETVALLNLIEQAHAPAWVKGHPLPASVLLPPQLMGRSTELDAAHQAWAGLKILLVTGEGGAGKSRFLAALLAARSDVIVASARPGDGEVGLSTLVRLIEQLAERWPELRGGASYAQLLKLATGAGMHAQAEIRSALPLATDLLRRAHSCGLAGLVLDDLQFADDASADVWFDWLDRATLIGVRFGFASRSASSVAIQRLGRLELRTDVVGIQMSPLPASQVGRLVGSLGLVVSDVDAVAHALVARVGGNPLHLLETIRRALEQHGELAPEALDAPAHVLDLMEQRLVSLRPEGLLLVRIAAVAGSDFSAELAGAVSRRDVLELADAWVALERQGILDARGFAHDLMLDAARRLLPDPIRRVLHARVASYCAPLSAPPGRLAYHWLEAGDPLAALPHLVASARLAWRTGRARETQEAFFQAAEIELSHGRPDAAFDLLFECSEAMARLQPGFSSSHILPRMQPLARTVQQRARIALLEAGSRYLGGDGPAATKGLADAFRLAVEAGDRRVEAECMYWGAWGASIEGRLRASVSQLSACAVLQRSLGLERLASIADATRLRVMQDQGQVRAVLAEQQRGWRALVECGDPIELASFRVAELANQLALGNVQAVDEGLAPAWQAVREADMHGEKLARCARTMLRILRRRGRWREALSLVDELRAASRSQFKGASDLAYERAALHLDLGRPDLAMQDIVQLERTGTSTGRPGWNVMALRWRYQAATGAPVRAEAVLQEVLRSEYLPMACELLLTAAEADIAQVTPAAVPPMIEGCASVGLHLYLAPLRALHLRLLVAAGVTHLGVAAELAGQTQLLDGNLGAAYPACALWLSQASHELGHTDAARCTAQQGAAWIQHCAEGAVPAGFEDTFCARNPTHRELLSLDEHLHS